MTLNLIQSIVERGRCLNNMGRGLYADRKGFARFVFRVGARKEIRHNFVNIAQPKVTERISCVYNADRLEKKKPGVR
jgi:hypothetical protein